MNDLEYKKNFTIQLHFFSKHNSPNLCTCEGLNNWYLITNHSTKTKTFFFLYLFYFSKQMSLTQVKHLSQLQLESLMLID